MPAFQGSLKLIGAESQTLRAVVDVERERLVVTASGVEIGNWDLPELSVSHAADGFHISVDDEELVFQTTASAELATTLGVDPEPTEIAWEPPEARRARAGGAFRRVRNALARVPTKIRIAFAILLVLAVTAFFALNVLLIAAIVAGAGVALVGGIALADPLLRAKLPSRWPPLYWLIAGLVFMIAALVVTAIT